MNDAISVGVVLAQADVPGVASDPIAPSVVWQDRHAAGDRDAGASRRRRIARG